MDFYIAHDMVKDGGPKVRMLETRSIYNYQKKTDVPSHLNDDVITAFLEEGGLHLNYWGYEAVFNDIAPHIMFYWASIVRQWY